MSNAAAEDVYKILLESKRRAFANPKWFFEKILNCTGDNRLEDWQLEGIEAIADVWRKLKRKPTAVNHKGLARLSYRSCHGPGKTHWLALIMHWWNYCFYGRVVCTAPKEKQLKTRLWSRYRKILRNADVSYRAMITVDKLNIKILDDEDWGCIGETASDPDNLSGYHDEPQLLLIDEASAKRLDAMFETLEGMLTAPGSVLAMIGNPTRTSGEFHSSHNKTSIKELYFRRHVKFNESRFTDKKWAATMAKKYGKDSPVYKVRVLGEFASLEENQLISLEWIEAAHDREIPDDGSLSKLRVSVDVGDGIDESVVTVARHYDSFICFNKMHRFSFETTVASIKTADEAERIFLASGGKKKSNDDFVVDSIGVGAGTAATLIKRGYNVVTYKGGSDSDNKKLWRNRRVQSYLVLRDGFQYETIAIDDDFLDDMDWEDFIAQLCSIKSKPGVERIEDLETKQELKARIQDSPDLADSAAMQMATQTPEIAASHFSPEVISFTEIEHDDSSLT